MTFMITDDCISCGTCLEACPCGCILEGNGKYEIASELCICCGTCADCCPVGAIVKEIPSLSHAHTTSDVNSYTDDEDYFDEDDVFEEDDYSDGDDRLDTIIELLNKTVSLLSTLVEIEQKKTNNQENDNSNTKSTK